MPKRAINKSEFVRSLPNLTAAQVVSKAKMRGFKLSTAHVYTIRSADRRKGATSTSRRVPGCPAKANRTNGANIHAAIKRLAADFTDAVLAELRGASIDTLRSI